MPFWVRSPSEATGLWRARSFPENPEDGWSCERMVVALAGTPVPRRSPPWPLHPAVASTTMTPNPDGHDPDGGLLMLGKDHETSGL